MSRKIEEILEVVQDVRDNLAHSPDASITSLRISADKRVANRRGLYPTSVSDSYRNRLKPEIKGTHAFDQLLEAWLRHGSDELEITLQSHRSDDDDAEAISNVFKTPSASEVDLATEFGYEPHDRKFKEGKDRLGWHLGKERNRSLIKSAKQK